MIADRVEDRDALVVARRRATTRSVVAVVEVARRAAAHRGAPAALRSASADVGDQSQDVLLARPGPANDGMTGA